MTALWLTVSAAAELLLRSAAIILPVLLLRMTLLRQKTDSLRLGWNIAVLALILLPTLNLMNAGIDLPMLDLSPLAVSVSPEALEKPGEVYSRAADLPLWLLWPAGATLVFCWFLTGRLLLAARLRGVRPCSDSRIASLVAECTPRPPRLMLHPDISTPMVFGLIRPGLYLPAEAVHWSDGRLEVVIRHELEHLHLGDLWWRMLAQVAVSLHWFNPLAWLLPGRMHADQERHVDAAVLRSGVRPSRYAAALLEAAEAPQSLSAVAFGRSNGLSRRIRTILSAEQLQQRRRGSSAALALLVCCMTAGLAINPVQDDLSEAAGLYQTFQALKEDIHLESAHRRSAEENKRRMQELQERNLHAPHQDSATGAQSARPPDRTEEKLRQIERAASQLKQLRNRYTD